MIKKRVVIFFLFLFVYACASHSRPTLYPNEVLKEKGALAASADIDQCLKSADEYLKSPEGKKVANGSRGFGTMMGGAVSIGGSSNIGVGVGVGTHDNGMSSMDVKRSFVNQCLANKGYQVLAWD